MTLKSILFITTILFLVHPVLAFEDTFQYYVSGDYSEEWVTDESGGYDIYHDIITYGETYSRCFRIGLDNDPDGPGEHIQAYHYTPAPSNYWAVNFRYLYTWTSGSYEAMKLNVYFYDINGIELFHHSFITNNPPVQSVPNYGSSGLFEYLRDSGSNQVSLRVNSVDQGVVGTATDQMAYISFRIDAGFIGSSQKNPSWMYIDDVTSDGNIVAFGTESTTHTVTEAHGDDTNISFSLNTYPFAEFTASEYEVDIKRSSASGYTDIVSETVKDAGDTTPTDGFSNWNRSVDITDGDTAYGLYIAYLLQDSVSVSTDYFFFAPPGDSSSISFSSTTIPIGTIETITYSIDSPDYGTYNYYIKVFSTTEEIQSTAVTDSSGTVTWDTEDEDAGLYYAVIARTHKTTGAYSELNYDIATLSENLVIRGYVYDAQTETGLSGAHLNFSQGATWYNTTSNATGYYELDDIVVNVELYINASVASYTHENFSFTPLAAQVYEIDLYMFNVSLDCDNTSIAGVTYDYPMHQAVPSATVGIYNGSWSDTTTSSSVTGFYLFEELANGSYSVNATQTGYLDSEEYDVDTDNGTFEIQNILLYGLYDLTIRAQDDTTDGYLSSFSVDYGGTLTSTTNGTVTYADLTYGLYTFSVSATGYYATSESILVDSTKTETIEMTQTDSIYYTPHYVKFIIQNIWGTKYQNVAVSVYEGSDTSTTYTGTTGSDGSVTFKLYETTQYRITFINATQGISESRILYPKDELYYVFVSSSLGSWDTYTVPISDAIVFSITKSEINSSAAYINVSYNDSLSETTDLVVYLNQTNESDYFNQTNLDTWSAGANSSGTYSFIVSPYVGESFFVHLVAQHTTYGEIDNMYSVSFKDDISDLFPGLPPSIWLYGSVFMLLFFGGIFVSSDVERGMLLICVMNFVFLAIGSYNSLPNNIETSILGGTILGFIMSLVANLNKASRDEGYQ